MTSNPAFRRPAVRAAGLAVLAAVLTTGLAAGCAGPSMERLDPSKDDDFGGTLIDSADIVQISDRASASLAKSLLASTRNDLVVAFPTIKNESRQRINTALLSDRIRDRLVQETSPRVKFLAREQLDEIEKERAGKREGVFSGEERKQLMGANFLLTGRILSLSKRYEGDTADYFQLHFQLTDAENGVIEWSNSFEFKKAGDAGVIYQ